MSNPFVGEVRLVGFNFAPVGWAFCDGQLMAIVQNETLFTLIGTTYGGDGVNTFGLPDLRGRLPIHMGQSAGTSNYVIGQVAGAESVTLTLPQLPAHAHVAAAAAGGNDTGSSTGMPASGGPDLYAAGAGTAPSITAMPTGGSQPHENMAPFVTLNFIISLFGIFPSSN